MFVVPSVLFLVAHLTFEGVRLAEGDLDGAPHVWFLAMACGCALLDMLLVLYGRRASFRRDKARLLRAPLLQIACGAVAAALEVFDVFSTAFVSTVLVLVWIYVTACVDLVGYDEHAPQFFLTRCTAYASLRAAVHVFVERASLPTRVERVVPFLVATVETVGMYMSASDAYRFARDSREFRVYATLKSVVFLSLPLLEDALLRASAS